MISAICFSKDRPLQLHAYLESLMHYSGMRPENIAVMCKESAAIPYYPVRYNFPDVIWMSEIDFFADLMLLIHDTPGDFILWGADDVVFKDYFDLERIETYFDDPSMLCFSLRYGRNLVFWNKWLSQFAIRQDGDILVFDGAKFGAYPWDISAAAYRKADVLRILGTQIVLDERARMMPGLQLIDGMLGTIVPISQLITSPNSLEWVVYNWYNFGELTHMACYELSRSLIFFVNRVQNVYTNPIDQRHGMGVRDLYRSYLNSKRLDWHSLEGWQNGYTHEGHLRFRLC